MKKLIESETVAGRKVELWSLGNGERYDHQVVEEMLERDEQGCEATTMWPHPAMTEPAARHRYASVVEGKRRAAQPRIYRQAHFLRMPEGVWSDCMTGLSREQLEHLLSEWTGVVLRVSVDAFVGRSPFPVIALSITVPRPDTSTESARLAYGHTRDEAVTRVQAALDAVDRLVVAGDGSAGTRVYYGSPELILRSEAHPGIEPKPTPKEGERAYALLPWGWCVYGAHGWCALFGYAEEAIAQAVEAFDTRSVADPSADTWALEDAFQRGQVVSEAELRSASDGAVIDAWRECRAQLDTRPLNEVSLERATLLGRRTAVAKLLKARGIEGDTID